MTTPASPYRSPLPYDESRMPAAAVYCSDGRYGEQMDDFLHHALGLPRYDRVAVPGGAACLASYLLAGREESAMEKQLRFLLSAHDIRRVVLIAHQDCGFYKRIKWRAASLEAQQRIDLGKAARRVRAWEPLPQTDAYFARQIDGGVQFERVEVEG